MKLTEAIEAVDGFTGHLGYPASALVPIGVIELLCALLYTIPRTRILGAILVAAYLGGAVASHVRVGDPWWTPVLLGVVAWGGLWLRDPRLRGWLPLVKD